MDYIRQFYKMPWLRRGMVADMQGKKGRVTSTTGPWVRIRFEGSRFSSICHPTWEMTYYGSDGQVVTDYKEKGNQRWIFYSG